MCWYFLAQAKTEHKVHGEDSNLVQDGISGPCTHYRQEDITVGEAELEEH